MSLSKNTRAQAGIHPGRTRRDTIAAAWSRRIELFDQLTLSRGLLLSGREEHTLLAHVVCLVLPISALYLASGQHLNVTVGALRAGRPSPAVQG